MMLFIILILTAVSVYIELHVFSHMFSISMFRGELSDPPMSTVVQHKIALWIAKVWWAALLFSLMLSHFLGYFFGAHGVTALVAAMLSTVITNVYYRVYLNRCSRQPKPFNLAEFLVGCLIWLPKKFYEAFT